MICGDVAEANLAGFRLEALICVRQSRRPKTADLVNPAQPGGTL